MLMVREEDCVRLAVDEAIGKWPRTEDAWDAVVWTLARDQYAGVALNDRGDVRSFVYDGARSIGMPSIEVIFTLEGNCVSIRDARFYEAPYARAGHA